MNTNTTQSKQIKLLISVLFLVLAGIAIKFFVTHFLLFGVISGPKNVSSATLTYTYTFSKELKIDQDIAKSVSLNQDLPYATQIDGKKLLLYLKTAPDIGKKFEIKMNDIESSQGKKFSHTYAYTIKYKATKDLSKKELQESIERSDSYEKSYPIIKTLPLNAKNYQLDYQFPDNGSNKMPISINCLTINPLPTAPNGDPLPDSSNDPAMAAYLSEIRRCRNDAIAQLKQMDYNTKLYQLVCKEPVLLEQYSCIYVNPSFE